MDGSAVAPGQHFQADACTTLLDKPDDFRRPARQIDDDAVGLKLWCRTSVLDPNPGRPTVRQVRDAKQCSERVVGVGRDHRVHVESDPASGCLAVEFLTVVGGHPSRVAACAAPADASARDRGTRSLCPASRPSRWIASRVQCGGVNRVCAAYRFEVEFEAAPNRNVDVAISASFNDAELRSTLTSTDASGAVSVVSGIEEGRRLPTVPKFQLACGHLPMTGDAGRAGVPHEYLPAHRLAPHAGRRRRPRQPGPPFVRP